MVFSCEIQYICEWGILCLCARFCHTVGTVGCDLTISIWVSRKESGLPERGFVHLGVHVGSRASLPTHGDFLYVPLRSTASYFGLYCGATPAAVHWFAAGSDYLRGLSSSFKPQQTWFRLFAKQLCSQTMEPVQQFLSNLILLTKDKNIQGFEEGWDTLPYNDHVGKAWKIFLWESMSCLHKMSQNFGDAEIVKESYIESCCILHVL